MPIVLPRGIQSVDHWARVIPFGNTTPVVTVGKDSGGKKEIYLEAIPNYVDHLKRKRCRAVLINGATGQVKDWDNDQRLEYGTAFTRAAKHSGQIVHMHATGNSVGETISNIEYYSSLREIDVIILAPAMLGAKGKKALYKELINNDYSKKPLGQYDNYGYCGLGLDNEDLQMTQGIFCVIKNSIGKGESVRVQSLLGRMYGFVVTQGDEDNILKYLMSSPFDGREPLRDDRIRASVATHGNLFSTVEELFEAASEQSYHDAQRLQLQIHEDIPGYTTDRLKIPQSITWLLKRVGTLPEDTLILGNPLTEAEERDLGSFYLRRLAG